MQPHTNGQRGQNPDSNRRVKVPTVQEALPYTPFVSIVPFETSIIRMPTISSIRASNIRTLEDNKRQSARNVLDQLSTNADRAETASAKCQKTLQDVKKLLQSNQLNLQFRKPVDRTNVKESLTTAPVKLSNFGRLVFDSVEFNTNPIQAAVDSNGPPTNGVKPNGHPQSPWYAQKGPAVISAVSKVQPVDIDTATIHSNATRVDEKAKGQASVNTLTTLLQEIFSADDSITSGDDSSHEVLAVFRLQDSEPSRLLTEAYQTRLESAVSKCVSAGRLDSIPVEVLKRAQSLCNDVISLSSEASFRPQDDWGDAEGEQWEQALVAAESSLLGTRIVLKIMTASSSEQELQSEDILKSSLKVMRNVAESCIVAIVEMHGSKKDEPSSSFSIAQQYHEQLVLVLRGFTRAIRALTALLAKVKIDESAISTIVYICKIILFAENASHDRDSVFGVQVFESSRRFSMDLLARIFDRYPEQRQFIFDEVLLSLEKLPATKQSARQYRLAADARPIQLVSALIMQLIQTSATRGGTTASSGQEQGDESDTEDADGSEDGAATSETAKDDATKPLQQLIEPLSKTSQQDAFYVTNILVQRALNTAKSADEPHRKLLDIFTDDFLTVLGLPEWPSAELLLRSLLRRMIAIVEGVKSTIPARNFALESLGRMGSGILEIQQVAQRRAQSDGVSEDLRSILLEALDGSAADPSTLLGPRGPHRKLVEHLFQKHAESTARTSLGCHIVQWSQQVCAAKEPFDRQAEVETSLHAMLMNDQWLDTHAAFEDVPGEEAKLAMLCIVINAPFCRAFPKIFSVLLSNVFNEHSTVKSRSLRSIHTLIETDPSILDRNADILRSILRCLQDASSLVRDSALGLVAKCTALQSQLDLKVFEHVNKRLEDTAVNVKKRAIKMVKEMYLRNENTSMRTSIATALIRRTKDSEESIVDLIKQAIEDIWFQPVYKQSLQGLTDANVTVLFQSQAQLLIQVVEASDEVPDALVKVLEELLMRSKHAVDDRAVAKRLVSCLFDNLVGDTPLPAAATQGMVLQVLAVVAQASPKLLTAPQLQLLDTYTKNLSSNEDLTIFRLALMILRHAMPHTTGLQKQFLTDLQNALMSTLGKLPNSEFPEVAVCLWTINSTLKNPEKLVNIIGAALTNVRNMAKADATEVAVARKLTRLMCLAGQFGKACDFETHFADVKKKVPDAKSDTVAGIIVETLAVFARPDRPLVVRQAALESICAVCQRWPKQFLRKDVGLIFDALLKEQNKTLESVMLTGMLGFFGAQEVSMSTEEDPETGATGRERLAKTYVSTDQDGATAALSQRYLQQILRLATSSTDDTAFAATKLISSIVRQGLPHPKECGPSLIALETSPNRAIAQIACAEHRSLHEKHETIIEKEYMRAMERALQYQQTVVGDARGWTNEQPLTAKLCFFWDVLKAGKAKVRQKYLTNIAGRLAFEPLDADLAHHFTFVRFITGNLAFFDYDKLEDLRLLVDKLSNSFATVGISLAQKIESEVFNMTVESLSSMPLEESSMPNRHLQVEPARLKTLSASAQILLLIAETRAFLLRVWGGQKLFQKNSKESKSLARSTHTPALSEAYIKRVEELSLPLTDDIHQRSICQTFSEVLSTDHEAKVDDDMDEDEGVSEMARSSSGTPSGRKRKLSIGPGPPKKRGRPRKTPSFNRYSDDDAEGEWE